MHTITAPTTRPARSGDLTARWAGAGAIAFAGIVALQNVLRRGAPGTDATSADVLAHFADSRATSVLLTASFVASGIALAVFVAGVLRRLLSSSRPGWAGVGLVGVAGVMSLFAAVVGCEVSLSAVAAGDTPSEAAIEGLWALHNGLFALVNLFVALALVGLARAGVAAGITPTWFDRVAPAGGALLLVGAASGPLTAAGDAMALFAVSLVGFLVWLAFLIATGRRMLSASAVTS